VRSLAAAEGMVVVEDFAGPPAGYRVEQVELAGPVEVVGQTDIQDSYLSLYLCYLYL